MTAEIFVNLTANNILHRTLHQSIHKLMRISQLSKYSLWVEWPNIVTVLLLVFDIVSMEAKMIPTHDLSFVDNATENILGLWTSDINDQILPCYVRIYFWFKHFIDIFMRKTSKFTYQNHFKKSFSALKNIVLKYNSDSTASARPLLFGIIFR